MPPLTPETLLQRSPDLRLQLHAGDAIDVAVGGQPPRRCGPWVLGVLDAFREPTTVGAALQRLSARAANGGEWAKFGETIRLLIEHGALIGPSGYSSKPKEGTANFSNAPIHIRMLNDRVRTGRFLAAIKAVVRPGDVVVEVGTGTGVLAVAAARAGARHVYTIEAGAMAPLARELVRANGLADRVTVVEGWSDEVTLPEKGDVFLSETIGNEAFDEKLPAIAQDAVKRHLKSGARMIPRDLTLFALPVQAPAEWVERRNFHAGQAREWGEWYGIDFASLTVPPANYPASSGVVYPIAKNGGWRWATLGEPVRLAHATLSPELDARLSSVNVMTATVAGELNAFVLFFTSELAPGISLSTDPRQPRADIPANWGNPVWLVPPAPLQAGNKMNVEFAWSEPRPHRWQVTRSPSPAKP